MRHGLLESTREKRLASRWAEMVLLVMVRCEGGING